MGSKNDSKQSGGAKDEGAGERARSLIPYACLYIDSTWSDLMAAYASTFTGADASQLEKAIAKRWVQGNAGAGTGTPSSGPVDPAHVMVTLSVRTALDLFLQVHKFPRGSHVLMSAINIPDMSVVFRHHGLVPVPVDVDPHTFLPDLTLAAKLYSPGKTVAFCAAHVFGRRFAMEPILEFCSARKLVVIEDAAEAMSGFGYTGDARSDISFVSFGSIKVATAYGGAISRVKSRGVIDAMRSLQSGWSTQTRWMWFSKVMKNTPVISILNVPLLTAAVQNTAFWCGIDHKAIVVSLLRGFPDRLIERLRTKPSASLLNFLNRRLTQFDAGSFQRNTDKCHLMSALLGNPLPATTASNSLTAAATAKVVESNPPVTPSSCVVPGGGGVATNYWLYPIVVSEPAVVITELTKLGVDAYRGATQLAIVPAPPEWKAVIDDAKAASAATATAAATASTASAAEPSTASAIGTGGDDGVSRSLLPVNAQYLMDHIVYLPVHKHVPDAEVRKMAATVRYVLKRYSPVPPSFPVIPSKL